MILRENADSVRISGIKTKGRIERFLILQRGIKADGILHADGKFILRKIVYFRFLKICGVSIALCDLVSMI